MKHVAWDYEDSINGYYQIYPITEAGELLLDEESICIYAQNNMEKRNQIEKIARVLDDLAE